MEDLLASIRAENVTFEAVKDNPSYHPGRCARVLVNGQEVGVLGQIHPLVAQNYDVDAELYCAELSAVLPRPVRQQGGRSPVRAPAQVPRRHP